MDNDDTSLLIILYIIGLDILDFLDISEIDIVLLYINSDNLSIIVDI